ncbi:hypothetical protein K474DRAFT_1614440 [Panus rudis PR-1116 ss-1]|nr:hypothetical protein K474DRAFT_1614440 [Panus rudis PR-1116 ss-1]
MAKRKFTASSHSSAPQPVRRSKRQKTSKVDSYNVDSGSESGVPLPSEEGPVDSPDSGIVAKVKDEKPKQPKKRKNPRALRGRLQDMPNMPFDVLGEIFMHLEPKDLLNLIRVNKGFRAFLLDSATAPFWRAARRNVMELPDIPPGMSEPAYAHLWFDNFCHNCLKVNSGEVYWELRIRLCKSCVDYRNHDRQEALTRHVERDSLWVNGAMIPVPIGTYYQGKYEFNVTLKSLSTSVWNEFSSLKSEERSQFIQRQTEKVRAIRVHAKACQIWQAKRSEEHARQLQDLRMDRLQSILKKLNELGWQKELEAMANNPDRHPLLEVPSVRVPRPLGPHSWPKIEGEVISFMQKSRKRRVERERGPLFRDQLRLLRSVRPRLSEPFGVIFPSERELLSFPEVKTLMNAPELRELKEEDLKHLEVALAERLPQWRSTVLDKIVARFCQQVQVQVDAKTARSLAIFYAAFCEKCQAWLNFVQLFFHSCFHTEVQELSSDDPEYDILVLHETGHYPWTTKYLCWDLERVKRLFGLCGMDPFTTKIATMNASDIRCWTTGNFENRAIQIHTWRSVLKNKFKILPIKSEDFAQVMDVEAKFIEKDRSQQFWSCSLCSDGLWCATRDQVEKHIKEFHNIPEPSDEHMAVDPLNRTPPRPVWLVQKGTPVYKVPQDAKDGFIEERSVLGQIHSLA